MQLLIKDPFRSTLHDRVASNNTLIVCSEFQIRMAALTCYYLFVIRKCQQNVIVCQIVQFLFANPSHYQKAPVLLDQLMTCL